MFEQLLPKSLSKKRVLPKSTFVALCSIVIRIAFVNKFWVLTSAIIAYFVNIGNSWHIFRFPDQWWQAKDNVPYMCTHCNKSVFFTHRGSSAIVGAVGLVNGRRRWQAKYWSYMVVHQKADGSVLFSWLKDDSLLCRYLKSGQKNIWRKWSEI
jgi:hypothetical protein